MQPTASTPSPQTEAPARKEAPVHDAPATYDDDLVPLDAYEGWSSEPARAGNTDEAAEKELADLKDALALFGEGVTLEQWD